MALSLKTCAGLGHDGNTVQNKIAEFLRKTLECASHAGALGLEAMLPAQKEWTKHGFAH
jgi:hypothetical protein